MAIPKTLDIPLQPRQLEAYQLVKDSPYTRIGIGGSRGGAKSRGGRDIILLRRFEHPGTRGMIFRRKFNDLWENHIQKFFEELPWTRGCYNVQNKEMTFRVHGRDSVLAFRYAEHEADVDDFLGKEYMDILIDEATQLSERALVKFEGCNRWPGIPDNLCKIIHTMNPGGPGHAYMKRVYITKLYKPEEDGSRFAYVPARAWDNVEWATTELRKRNMTVEDYYRMSNRERFEFFINFTQYGKQLNALPEGLRIGWLLGNWDKFAGQYFTNFFEDRSTRDGNWCRAAIQPWHPRWISMDWGFAQPAAIYWHAMTENGVVITYREMYGRQIGERTWGQRIADASEGEQIRAFYLSPDAYAKRNSQNTVAEEIGSIVRAHNIPRPVQADWERVGGWRLMYEMIERNTWIISQDCPKLIESIPMLVRKSVEDNPEDAEEMNAGETDNELGDDCPDAARYGLKSHLRPRKKPPEIVDREQAANIQDPYVRHFFLAKRQAERENHGQLFQDEGLEFVQGYE